MKKLALHWKIIIGMVLGIIWALLSSTLGWSEFTIDWIDPFGTIFINLLKLIAVPLVLFSIISGVANIGDPSSLGRMGGKTLGIYLITTVMAISLGLLLVNIVPDNFFYSLSNNGLMLQIIFFAIFFGVCLLFIPNDKSAPVLNLVDGINEVFLKMVDLVMQAAPFFVFALLAGVVSKMAGDDIGKVVEIFKGLSWYSLTVLVGLLLMIFVIYPMILKLFVKQIPYKGFFKSMSPAQTLAFSTSSSAATLPVTMECVEHNLGVNKKIASFVLPIGATVNMDGTSMYQAVAVIFLAQMHLIDLTLGQQLVVVATATLASIGSAAVPSAGLVMLIIVLDSVGLNPAWIAIIFPVDRILDMFRTVVNVTGDATVCSIIADGENMLDYQDKKSPTETFEIDS